MAKCQSRRPGPSLAFCTRALSPMQVQLTTEARLQMLLDPRRIVRWIYTGRLSVAAAIFLAAMFRWESALRTDKLVASLCFAAAMVFTAASAMYSESARHAARAAARGGPFGVAFLYVQSLFDLVLVTGVVHVTGGSGSQFAALYILVIAGAALLMPTGGGLVVAAIGILLYYIDALWLHPGTSDLGVLLQLGVFGAVALGSGYISARLRELGAGRAQELAAEFSRSRLQATDILRNIRSGIITVDAEGVLLFANPADGVLLGFDSSRLGARGGEHLRALAHEIKNPLASIRSAVEQLADIAFDDPDAQTLSALVLRESDRLDRLLVEFLDFARVRVASRKPVDVGAVARGAVSLVV